MLDKVREDKMNINELLEPNAKKAVFTFGRFNPPTVGHARLMDVVKNAASGADHYVFTGKTNDPKKNPLQYKDKITFLRAMFPHMNIMDDPAIRTPWEALEELGKQYDEVVMVVGSDRKDDFEQQMRPYLKDFGIEKFSIVSSGERDADSNDVSGMSASKARAFARAGDFKSFSQSINGGEKLKQQVYNKVRQGMGITEMANKPKMPKKPEIKSRDPNWRDMEALRKSGAAGSHKDKKALDKRGYQKHKGKSYDINESSLSEILGFVTRPAKRTTIKKKPEKFDEPSIQDKIKARRAAAAKGDKNAWKSTAQKTSEAPQGKPIAYVDMDGVIANFFAEYAKMANAKTYRDIPPAKVDPTLNKMIGTDFFNRLPKFPTTDKLIQMVVKEFGSYKILSSPLRGDHENSKEQKIKWIKRELAIQPDEIIVVGRKESYAVQADGTQNILIDDRGKNIEGWLSRGGYGIKYQADEDPLSKVSDGIKDFKEKNNLTEWGGRVVKGINTTVDVGVDAIKKQSAKMGFKVTKDGVPPILAPKNLRSVKRMQEALIKINGSNKDLTLQQQIDLQEIKKGIGKMLKATREVASEVPYQNDGGSMSLLTHPGTKLHQKMRATAKPGTDDWFKTWRTLAYLTKGRKNHYMLPVKEQLERLLIEHGLLEAPVQQAQQALDNVEQSLKNKDINPDDAKKLNNFLKNMASRVAVVYQKVTGQQPPKLENVEQQQAVSLIDTMQGMIADMCQKDPKSCADLLMQSGYIKDVSQVENFVKTILPTQIKKDQEKIKQVSYQQGFEKGTQEYKTLDPMIMAMLKKVGSDNPQDLAKAREIFVNDNIDIVKAKKFLQQAKTGVIDMNKMTTLKKGTLKDILVGDADVKDTFNKVIDDFINWIPGRTAGNIGPGELALVMLGNPASKETKGDLGIGNPPVMYEVKAGGAPQKMTAKGTLGAPKRSGAFFDPGKSGYDARPQVEKVLKSYGFEDFTSYKMRKGKKEPLFNYELTHTRFDNWNNEFDRLGFDIDKRAEVLANVAAVIYAPGINAVNPEFPLEKVKADIKSILSKTNGLLKQADADKDGEKFLPNNELIRYYGKLALEKYR